VRFQHRYGRHGLLFALTMVTTSLAGALHALGFLGSDGEPVARIDFVITALSYSFAILVILAAHEFGHYAYCRKHRVDATLPYFIPAPLPLTGTLGAVIRIKETFPSKAALFDIGVAGPIAGFVALLPFLYFGVSMSVMLPFEPEPGTLFFGEPLLFKAMAWLRYGARPEGYDIVLHPMGFAAWFGLLATALNLLPFGQLDGGHIVYSIIGRRASYVSLATLGATAAMTFVSSGWNSVAIMMFVMALLFGVRHPHIIDEDTPLDGRRKVVAFLALVIFLISFTPVPIQFRGQAEACPYA
jgi:membrane-associated protease RseP (regulator of RpoE activity)